MKHGLVSRVGDWPFSSFHRDVSAGLFSQDWAGEFDAVGEFGEVSNGAIKVIAPYNPEHDEERCHLVKSNECSLMPAQS